MKLVGKSQVEKDKMFAERSALNYAQQITPPLLPVHGEGDTVVPIARTGRSRKGLRSGAGTLR